MSSFLVCDEPKCDGRIDFDRDLTFCDIGTGCPKCGTNMLTVGDFHFIR